MSVIIKGMKIPEDCFTCPLKEEGSCNLTYELATDICKRNNDCPLIPLPEHHGRLIDGIPGNPLVTFEKDLHNMFDHIWDCDINHPIFQDTVGDLMEAVLDCARRRFR